MSDEDMVADAKGKLSFDTSGPDWPDAAAQRVSPDTVPELARQPAEQGCLVRASKGAWQTALRTTAASRTRGH